MTLPPANVSVGLPVGQAIERVKRVLFQPFDLGKWITIGFCAWLAYLGQGGFHGSYNFSSPHGGGAGAVREWVEQARHYVTDNLIWIVPLAAILQTPGVGEWLPVA